MVDLKDLIPDKPSGYNGQCRSKLSMAADAASLGRGALVPPVAGAAYAAYGAGDAALKNFSEGHIGAGFGALAAGIPSAAAGFFGGGVAADAAQGLTNEGLDSLGADTDRLPASNSRNMAMDSTCQDPAPSMAVPVPKGKPVIKESVGPGGWRMKVTINPGP